MLDSIVPATTGSFDDLLESFRAGSTIGSDDVIAAVRVLLDDVSDLHQQDKVACLDRVDLLATNARGELQLGMVGIVEPSCYADLDRLSGADSSAVTVVRTLELNETARGTTSRSRDLASPDEVPDRPVFFPNYGSWERAVGHHDALTDIFHLGLLLASLSTGLNFRDASEMERFIRHRPNLARLNPRLHPVLVRVIADMTELDRAKRAADLDGLIDVLDSYRDVEVDDGARKSDEINSLTDPGQRRQVRLRYLRNRLFEVTRRNKLLYFSERHGIDLTRGSFPLMLNYRLLQPRQLLSATPQLLAELAECHQDGQPKGVLDLRRWLRTQDYPFLPIELDKLRAAARRDQREVGFNQLRLVLAFLRWHDDERGERINTPLVMVPVSLKRVSGTQDGFTLTLENTVREAEINPVLRYILSERFKIDVPEAIDFSDLQAIDALRLMLEKAMRRVKPGIAIELTEKPKIQLIQKTIRRQLDDHRRKQRRAGQQMRDWQGIAYSYSSDSYQPLGAELFDRFVRTKPAPGREFAGGSDVPTDDPFPDATSPGPTRTEVYAFEDTELGDPLNWEIDLCAVTLANFNTRKMGLVRDYRDLLGGGMTSHVNDDRLFSQSVRPAFPAQATVPQVQRSFVLPSDPSQDEAILRARTGLSYVIQGPPGTGKSQTIANLLADLAAQGKSVLFVCEKRVALDVVATRLEAAGIGDLACLIHDARDDRLPFITGLKRLYEDWQGKRLTRSVDERRKQLAAEIGTLIDRLERFSRVMQTPVAPETHVRNLMDLALAEKLERPLLSHRERECLPDWVDFLAGHQALSAVASAVDATRHLADDTASLLKALRSDLAETPRPAAYLEDSLAQLRPAAGDLAAVSEHAVPLGGNRPLDLQALITQSRLAARLRALADAGKFGLLDPLSAEAVALQKVLEKLSALERRLADHSPKTAGWRHKPGLGETHEALRIALATEGRFWSFLSGDWRRVKRLITEHYQGQPGRVVEILERLAAEHTTEHELRQEIAAAEAAYGLKGLRDLEQVLGPAWSGAANPAESALIEACLADPDNARKTVARLGAAHQRLQRAKDALAKVFSEEALSQTSRFDQWIRTLETLGEKTVDLVRRVRTLERSSPALARSWRVLSLDDKTFRSATLHEAIAGRLPPDSDAASLTGADVRTIADALDAKLAELRALNAKALIEARVTRFKERLANCDAAYESGRATLEHQFSLQRPSASMRALLTNGSGTVIRDLKPIWMMSPLSVADTLPLKADLFDVVVFDEASQIAIEEALPTLHRAPQMIVVGDEMQLPPPSYFSKRITGDDDSELPDYIAFGMQAESLLNKAVQVLPAVRLDWHYRSRHEALIGFCNQAFYNGHLKTIPSRQPIRARASIDTTATVPMKTMAQRVLDRPISYHRIADGTFQNQQNLTEAAYIAELVKALLAQETGRSIGIVAFSQSQQAAVEEALEALAGQNEKFRARLEAAFGAEQDELFVKNLENVQGDERDIIIVSVAYAPGPSGRMLMNFGPINQEGGEKRLNVIFSRAKHHVAVVSSIEPDQITNDYNKGANALKRYLMYAAAVSAGDTSRMELATAGLPGAIRTRSNVDRTDPLADAVAEFHAAEGFDVVRGLGQSTAKCDVALRPAGAADFTTAILTDNAAHYDVADLIDRYVTYPALLRSAGWSVEFALAKDWLTGDANVTAPAARTDDPASEGTDVQQG
jgi:hypothetical protein